MVGGYMGRILSVDLSSGALREEPVDEGLARQFLGGFGLGVRLIWERQRPGVDPLSPDNMLGFMTGPLTGTPAIIGSRYAVVGKSPLTGTWGDANSGGSFGPHMKFAGFDGVLFKGASERPVYLFLQEGKAELRDARPLWGLDTAQTEDALKAELGAETEVACIGPAGEKLALIAGVINNKGRAAARSGLGALMGSKKLKAIAVQGHLGVPLADAKRMQELHRRYLSELEGPLVEYYRKYGTCGGLAGSAISGDAPVKNWKGAGPVDMPNADAISDDDIIKYQEKRYACWHCPLGCGGHVRVKTGPFAGDGHKPEYETLAALGTMTLVADPEAIIRANDLCNRLGFDTISAGATLAFAMECAEEGLLAERGLGSGPRWGNAGDMVALLEQMGRREGLGDVLADGVRAAAERIGGRAEEFAVHVHGQELPMHDSRNLPALALSYWLDATPGRHTRGGHWAYDAPAPTRGRLGIGPKPETYTYSGLAPDYIKIADVLTVMDISGLCQFGYECMDLQYVVDFLAAATGWDVTLDEVVRVGERVTVLRHLFNLREGLNPRQWKLPGRMLGRPPLTEGSLAGVTIDEQTLAREYLAARQWDQETTRPAPARLRELGLDGLAG